MFGNKKRDDQISDLRNSLDYQLHYVRVRINNRADWIKERILAMVDNNHKGEFIVVRREDMVQLYNWAEDIKKV